jgi:hypothetical protein
MKFQRSALFALAIAASALGCKRSDRDNSVNQRPVEGQAPTESSDTERRPGDQPDPSLQAPNGTAGTGGVGGAPTETGGNAGPTGGTSGTGGAGASDSTDTGSLQGPPDQRGSGDAGVPMPQNRGSGAMSTGSANGAGGTGPSGAGPGSETSPPAAGRR